MIFIIFTHNIFRCNVRFDSLQRELMGRVEKFSVKSLQNDIDVLLNMYSKDKEIIDPEDKPFPLFSSENPIAFIQYLKDLTILFPIPKISGAILKTFFLYG